MVVTAVDRRRDEKGGTVDDTITNTTSLTGFLSAIGRYPQLPRDELARLAERLKAGDVDARRTMIRSNLRLAVAVASDHREQGLCFWDLVQEAVAGLVAAVDTFDRRLGTGFEQYARWSIQRAVRTALAAAATPELEDEVDPRLVSIVRAIEARSSRELSDVVA
jgi:RNA polymerase nonessential primary-like sigma factor